MKFVKFSLFLLVFGIGFLYASMEPKDTAIQRVETLKDSYLQDDNVWLEKLRELKYFELLQLQIDELKKKKQDKKSQEKIYLLEESKKLYSSHKGIYYDMSKIDNEIKKLESSIDKIGFFDIVTSKILDDLNRINKRFETLQVAYFKAIKRLNKYIDELNDIKLNIDDIEVKKHIEKFLVDLNDDVGLLEISYKIFEKKMTDFSIIKDHINNNIYDYKKRIIIKFLYIIIIIGFLLLINKLIVNYLLKHAKNKDEESEQKYFVLIKMSNIAFLVLAFLVLAFAYIENIAASLAVFGVIGAGLTIVLKEWVLSFIAWFYILGGNFIRPGDRIKIEKDSSTIIGDVADISMFRLTLYENITNDSITEHKKAGRIIFVPNYYILIYSVYNYTHITMQTIIDLIEINLTFNSNLNKAEEIAQSIVDKLTERYSSMAQNQYNKLKNRYSLRNMSMQTKIVFFPSQKGDGVTMGIWYVSPYRQVLRLKSDITKQLISKLDKCDDIALMYTGSSMFIESTSNDEKKDILNV